MCNSSFDWKMQCKLKSDRVLPLQVRNGNHSFLNNNHLAQINSNNEREIYVSLYTASARAWVSLFWAV